jgi:chloramphenicol-sensitive protein RarD
MSASTHSTAKIGLLYGLGAYGLWGLVPIYFKNVQAVPPREMLAHRIVWSALLLLVILAIARRLKELVGAFRSRHTLTFLLASTLFIATNWYVFIYSVLTGQILQGSLGYFILPLVNVAVGTLFFGERMSSAQWIALFFATGGVLVLIFWLGLFPWIALTLAFSFSAYGILRKHAPVESTIGLTVETLLLTPIALGCLLFWNAAGSLALGNVNRQIDLLIVLSGFVTTIPLICFGQAVQRLRIVTIGFLQYISPTLAFLIAVLVYDETFPPSYQFGYGLIWCGVAIFVGDAIMGMRNAREPVEERKEAEVVPLD